MAERKDFAQKMQQIEERIAQIQTMRDPAARASAQELVQLLMDLHGEGLHRILEIIWEIEESHGNSTIIDRLGQDPLVGSLLLLYNLHPLDLQTRVTNALDKVRPYLRSHGGNVELIDISNSGDVRLKLQGSCHGCPSSAMTLKLAIEEAIYEGAPDIQSLSVEGVVEQKRADGFIPVQHLQPKQPESAGWQEVQGLEGMDQGTIKVMEVHGQPILFCRIESNFYAYSSTCPECNHRLAGTRLGESAALICGRCGQRYDALRAGRGLDKPALHLEPFPLLMREGKARIALSV
jgi:Fe-S cluster biogenesis protein NfuA/nitrite reductase/ring-hydroxylating ferredoxin subunit